MSADETDFTPFAALDPAREREEIAKAINDNSSPGGNPDWANVQNKPDFAPVATSGSYTDLSDQPNIPPDLKRANLLEQNNDGLTALSAGGAATVGGEDFFVKFLTNSADQVNLFRVTAPSADNAAGPGFTQTYYFQQHSGTTDSISVDTAAVVYPDGTPVATLTMSAVGHWFTVVPVGGGKVVLLAAHTGVLVDGVANYSFAKDARFTKQVVAPVAGVVTIDRKKGQSVRVNVNADITSIVITNYPPTGTWGRTIIKLVYGGAFAVGGWDAQIKWGNGGVAPTPTGIGGAWDKVVISGDSGQNDLDGDVVGQGYNA